MSWIMFRGVRSDQLGAVISKMPSPVRAARRVEKYELDGRHGELHMFDGAYEQIELEATLNLFGAASIDAMNMWLDGYGDLVLSDDPGKCYKATVIDEIDYTRYRTADEKRYDELKVRFSCHPFRYLADPEETTLNAAGAITNPGTAESKPIITVYGSGDGVLTINGSDIQFEGISGEITIDTEAGKVYSAAAGAKMTGDFPVFPTGETSVAFSGGITGVKINPRWRWK